MNVSLEAPYKMAPGIVAGIHRTIVRVTTTDGVVGLGEATSPDDAAGLNGELGQRLVGKESSALLAELGRVERPCVEHHRDGKVLIDTRSRASR